ncbi:putative transcriptional regulator, IclR family protein [Mycobacterium gallinarum]|uniref:Transcriptional regulator, IclR family protein n=1 Tax=Mycobacterium gallinarum TaxID=39689 RepID=A0A9W4FDE4_9MYCO|nr:putative transcriptional regulator, IclR family protein [Mycobacterium gallinarum]
MPSPPTERVVAVMHLLAAHPERNFSLADICRSLGISRATGHAILATLAHHRWVVRHESSASYSWGPAIGALARPTNDREFRPLLENLSETVGAQVFLARRENASLVVTDSVGDSLTAPRVTAGLRMPLVAPFGRDYVAWAGEPAIKAWLAGIGEPSTRLRRRLTAVLAQVRERGYVIERLSREYVRVYMALRALAADGEPDEITARLAGAFADLALVDYLPAELDGSSDHQVATISVPVKDSDGLVSMSITAAPFRGLNASEIRKIGAAVCDAARRIEESR